MLEPTSSAAGIDRLNHDGVLLTIAEIVFEGKTVLHDRRNLRAHNLRFVAITIVTI